MTFISGIALINGIKFKRGGTICTARRKTNGRVYLKITKQSKAIRKLQLIALFLVLIFSMQPDTSTAPQDILYTLIIPLALFMLALRFIPNLRILNYHGAEHKIVVAYRNRLPLTLENVKPLSRVTHACGTMLVAPICFNVLLLSAVVMISTNILLQMLLTGGAIILLGHYFLIRGEETIYIDLSRLLPFLKKKPYRIRTNPLYKAFDKIGYFLQAYFTTREPSDEELKVAILCMQRLLSEK